MYCWLRRNCRFWLCLVVLVYLQALSSSTLADTQSFLRCTEAVLAVTQRCSNANKAYATLIGGGGSGFGSEFLAFFSHSLLTSMVTNRRYIFVKAGRRWEYDCSNQSAWACYFTFMPCADSAVTPAKIDISKLLEFNHYPRDSGSDFIVHETLMHAAKERASELLSNFQKVIHEAYAEKYPILNDVCPSSLTPSDVKISLLAGVIAAKLYQVTDEMQRYLNEANAGYYRLFKEQQVPLSSIQYQTANEFFDSLGDPYLAQMLRTGDFPIDSSSRGSKEQHHRSVREQPSVHLPIHHYAAVQLRLTDKRYETPDADWKLISDMRYVASSVWRMLRDYHGYHPDQPPLRHLYIATDNCTAAGELVHHLRHLSASTSSSNAANIHAYNGSDRFSATNTAHHSPHSLFFLGACFQPDGRHIREDKRNWNPRQDRDNFVEFVDSGSESTQRLKLRPVHEVSATSSADLPRANAVQVMADLDMLRHGAVFMGSFFSNFARLVHYLRVSAGMRHRNSYHFVIDDPKFQDRDEMQPHF